MRNRKLLGLGALFIGLAMIGYVVVFEPVALWLVLKLIFSF